MTPDGQVRSLRVSLGVGDRLGTGRDLDEVINEVGQAAAMGFGRVWFAQSPWAVDALTTIAVVGRAVPGIELGTAVVPIFPRHPALLAQQARTVDVAVDHRLVLGIGLSHQAIVEGYYGYKFERPAARMAEYLDTLLPLLAGETAAPPAASPLRGLRLDVSGPLRPPPVYLGALGPRLLALAGARVHGTITWMTGPDTVRGHIRPHLDAAANEAGRERPEVVCGLPVCVTRNATDARHRIAEQFAEYGRAPSYRRMLDRERAGGPADVALVGGQGQVVEQMHRLAEAGADELLAVVCGTEQERADTRELLAARFATRTGAP
ncbi:MAG TPA: TIGR03564 family F420-dependent LLM class oxidoreductase [Pseudonocardia sp.]